MLKQHKLRNLTVDAASRTIQITNGDAHFQIALGIHLRGNTEANVDIVTADNVILSFNDETVTISYRRHGEVDIYTVLWRDDATETKEPTWPTDSIPLSNGHWYGGPELLRQEWPIAGANVKMQPYISSDMVSHTHVLPVYGSFVERYFLNSLGYSIVVDEETPLWVGMNENNDGKIRLCGRFDDKIYPTVTGHNSHILKYDIIVGDNVKTVHQFTMKKYFRPPTGIPDDRMFRFPIWSTWARYKQDISQQDVLKFAKDISHYGFPNSQLEIDDMWSTAYGDLSFDHEKFPDPKEMVQKLHDMNFRVTLWTTPFFNVESENLRRSLDYRWIRDGPEAPKTSSLFVSGESNAPALIKWWNGYGATIDFTNPEAAEWYIARHRQLQDQFAIDSYKFDAGEAEFLPSISGVQSKSSSPTAFTKAYVECVSKFGGMIEVRSGYKSQHLPVFTRMMDKFSNWSHTNGLRSLIPTCLTLSITGYPFVLPDMIGGNAYFGGIPSKELYIRWVEISAFMPAMQFSVVPWQYEDDVVVQIAKKYVDIHASYVTPIILRYAHMSTVDGSPIIRPIWWVDPKDKTTHTVDDEFLIGDEILVAPVVYEGNASRDIYLPEKEGWRWKDERTGQVFDGKQWLKDYNVALDEIAYFCSIKSDKCN